MTTWNPILSDGRVIEGRTLYSDGQAITKVYVILEGASEGEGRTTYSKDGTYRFLSLGEGPFSIRVQMWKRPEGAVEPFVEGVFPSNSPVDIVATFESPQEVEHATVRVRLVDETERGIGEGTVVIESSDGNSRRFGESHGANWIFRLEEPGVYRAVALHGGRVIRTGADFEIAGGESIDLPDLVAGPGGTLILKIERPEHPVPTGLRAFLRRKPTRGAESFELGGQTELRIDNLEPGTGRISFLGDNIGQLELEFEVRAGEETHLAVPLTPAVPVLYRIEWPKQDSTGTMSIRILDRRTGALVDGYEIDDLAEYSSPISWNAYLPLGSYKFEVKKNGSLHQSEDFEVTSLDPKKAPKVGFE